MTSRDFCYWLQGAFELCDANLASSSQVKVLDSHLKMVEVHQKTSMGNFCSWLRGVLDVSDSDGLSDRVLQQIKEKLNAEFEHVIDPSFPSNQQSQLNQTHQDTGGGWGSPPYDGVRC